MRARASEVGESSSDFVGGAGVGLSKGCDCCHKTTDHLVAHVRRKLRFSRAMLFREFLGSEATRGGVHVLTSKDRNLRLR